LGVNNSGAAKSLEKLSSGFRINRAGDDAAGLAISEKMRAQIRGLNRASSNAQDGVSLIQAAEGALQETHSILQRMRELSIQAANDTNQTIDRQAIQNEIDQLTREVDRIANTTEFNKMTILDGSLANGKFIKSVSGFNVSGLDITPMFDDDGNSTIVDSLTTIAIVEAGVKFNVTYDFALNSGIDADNETPAFVNNLVAEGGIGNIAISLSEDVMITAGLNLEDGENAFFVAVNVGDSGAVIAGNVRDMLQNALGADWNITATGSQLNVEYNFVGAFAEGISFSWEGEADGLFALEDGGEVGDISGFNATGTHGRDVIILINGSDDIERTGEGEFGEAGVSIASTVEWNNEPGEDQADGIALRGRETISNLYFVNEEGTVAFSFNIDDATKLSGAIISVAQGSDMSLQVGANAGYSQTIQLEVGSLSAKSLGIGELNVLSHKDSQNATISIDTAIQRVSDTRAGLGAVQNRLEHTIANLDTVSENLQDAESRIRDVDLAKEMMNFTKFSILMQASQAMLAQANSLPQGVLQLLR
jgi:flagellin